MNDRLQENLDKKNGIVQVQEKLATVGKINYNQLKERNEEHKDKLQETDEQNKSLKCKLMNIHDDNLIFDHNWDYLNMKSTNVSIISHLFNPLIESAGLVSWDGCIRLATAMVIQSTTLKASTCMLYLSLPVIP